MKNAITEPLKSLRLSTTNRPIEAIFHWRNEGWLLLDPPYQRGDVWGPTRRVNLIRSILLGIPIPSIIINDRLSAGWPESEWLYAVIDGKQRCSTLLRFLDSELPIPGEWVGMEGPAVFRRLPIAVQRKIKQHPIAFCEGALETLGQEQEVFELVNYGGVPQGQAD